MSISVGFTPAEVHDLVFEYQEVPYGQKLLWLREHGISRFRMHQWRCAVFGGDLDRNLIPRKGSAVNTSGAEQAAIARRRAAEQAAHAAEVERLNARIRELEDVNGALGKAIGLLHEKSEHEPDSTPTIGDPSNSSRSRTDSSSS